MTPRRCKQRPRRARDGARTATPAIPTSTHRLGAARTLARWAAALACCAALHGCATVTVSGADGQTRIERGVGIVQVNLAPGTAPLIADVRAVGMAQGPAGLVLGATRQRWVALPPECHVVVWMDDARQQAALRELLGPTERVCVVP